MTCRECRPNEGGRRWLWWCEECAEECRDRHRRDFGHVTELVVVPGSVDALREEVARVDRLMGGRGW